MLSSVAILQARTSSSRLPAKVLLPVCGLPLAVLAAKRAGNTGRKVIVATSDEQSDDVFAAVVRSHGLDCFRGSLDNTLERIVDALSRYENDTIVMRLTGDNVFPDGHLLDEIESDFISRGLDYLSCNGEPSGLPYGLSVEVTRVGCLREAASQVTSKYDQEHVTPYVIRKFGANHFEKYKHLGKGHFRCTVDCLDDYLGVQKVFEGIVDPVNVSALVLVDRLNGINYQPIVLRTLPELVVGGAQLGLVYGIANEVGRPSAGEAERLLKTAIANGVVWLDTARAYGSSEQVIASSLADGWAGRVKIITKLSTLDECPDDIDDIAVRALVDASVYQSCAALRKSRLDVLMLHRASHLQAWGGAVWRRLVELRALGVIGELGVSVQYPHELENVLKVEEAHFIQMPFNILDWRWEEVLPQLLEKRSGNVTVHVRSALLQGLLQSDEERHWEAANVTDSAGIRDWLSTQAKRLGFESVIGLCLAYVRSKDWVDGVVVGMEQQTQLLANLRYFDTRRLTCAEMAELERARPRLQESTLDPSRWQRG